CLQFKAYPNSF
nr:immunoglobulin light chain junction region [Macaca mulatta]